MAMGTDWSVASPIVWRFKTASLPSVPAQTRPPTTVMPYVLEDGNVVVRMPPAVPATVVVMLPGSIAAEADVKSDQQAELLLVAHGTIVVFRMVTGGRAESRQLPLAGLLVQPTVSVVGVIVVTPET